MDGAPAPPGAGCGAGKRQRADAGTADRALVEAVSLWAVGVSVQSGGPPGETLAALARYAGLRSDGDSWVPFAVDGRQ